MIDKELTTIVEPDDAVLGAFGNPQLREYAINLQKQHYAMVPDANIATIKSAYIAVCPADNLSPLVAKQMQAVKESVARMEKSASSLRDPQYPSWGRLFFTQIFDKVPAHVRTEIFLHRAAFTLLFTQDINGWTIPTDHGDVMAVDAKLFPGLIYLNNAFQKVSDASTQRKELPGFAALNDVLLPFVLYFTCSLSARVFPLITAPNAESVHRSKILASHQATFVIAHEIAHAALGHLRQAPVADPSNRPGFSSSETHVDVLMRRQAEEFAADLYAYSAVKAKFARRMQDDPKNWTGYLAMSGMIPTAIGTLFAYLHCIEAMSRRIQTANSPGIPVLPAVGEHPAPRSRMQNLFHHNPFDLFLEHETVERAWTFADRWVDGLNAMGDAAFARILADATNGNRERT